ncbi:hypothetical protein ACVWZV_009667 [Bradyrhizobium sp. GM5.1]
MMAALAKALSHSAEADTAVDGLKVIMMFCGASLFLSLVVAMSYGIDLGAELFSIAPRHDLPLDREPASLKGIPRDLPDSFQSSLAKLSQRSCYTASWVSLVSSRRPSSSPYGAETWCLAT